jgi:transcriptional regulator with XRE-family HTH domain
MPRKSKTDSGNALALRIGRNIKNARTLLGMTQGQLAELLDLENVTVSRIETGAQLPSIDRLDEVAKALNVSLTTLLADTNKSSAMADLLVDAIKDLPVREQKFVHSFAVTYAAHWKAGKKNL